MRSLNPMAGNPWPHDMVLTIEDDGKTLGDLLWIREAWALEVDGDDLPPRLAATPEPVGPAARADASADPLSWQAAWPGLWRAALAHASGVRGAADVEAVQASPPGSAERLDLLSRLLGPQPRELFGHAAFDDPSHTAWANARFHEHRLRMPLTLEDQPERRSLDALIRAWRRGLEKVVTIPCAGEFTRVLGPHTLLVTDRSRRDAESYSRALAAFAERG